MCHVAHRGTGAMGAPAYWLQGKVSLSTRSSRRVVAIVGHRLRHMERSAHCADTACTSHVAASEQCFRTAGRATPASRAADVLLCKIQVVPGPGCPYHVSPAVLDASFHSASAIGSPRHDPDRTNVSARATSSSPRVPAAVRGAVMRGTHDPHVDMWGSNALDRVVHPDQPKTVSHHRIWQRSTTASSSSAFVHGLQNKVMRSEAVAMSTHKGETGTSRRESALSRTLYTCEWQSTCNVLNTTSQLKHPTVHEQLSKSAPVATSENTDGRPS